MKELLVSVIIPVYKVEKYLSRAVESVINQTYRNLEIILVDDGSPDNCPAICDDYAVKDSRVQVIHKANGGLSDARNVALDIAKGKYVTFLDSDDYLAYDIISKQMQIMMDECVDVVCCGINVIDGNCNIYSKIKADKSFKIMGRKCAKLLLEDVYPYNFCCSKIFKSSLFDGVRFPIGRIYEDTATTYVAISRAREVYCMEECLYYYEREREGNITSELNSDKAAWSYFCGCLNSKEAILFCRERSGYADTLPIVINKFFNWSKLCIESAIYMGINEYINYCAKVKKIWHEANVPIPIRLKLIIKFNRIYFNLYPIIKEIKCRLKHLFGKNVI